MSTVAKQHIFLPYDPPEGCVKWVTTCQHKPSLDSPGAPGHLWLTFQDLANRKCSVVTGDRLTSVSHEWTVNKKTKVKMTVHVWAEICLCCCWPTFQFVACVIRQQCLHWLLQLTTATQYCVNHDVLAFVIMSVFLVLSCHVATSHVLVIFVIWSLSCTFIWQNMRYIIRTEFGLFTVLYLPLPWYIV